MVGRRGQGPRSERRTVLLMKDGGPSVNMGALWQPAAGLARASNAYSTTCVHRRCAIPAGTRHVWRGHNGTVHMHTHTDRCVRYAHTEAQTPLPSNVPTAQGWN